MWNQRYKGINSETFVDESGKYLMVTACVTIFKILQESSSAKYI